MSPSSNSRPTAGTSSPGQRRHPKDHYQQQHNLNSQCKRLATGRCILTQLLIGTVIWAFVPMIIMYYSDVDTAVVENAFLPFQHRLWNDHHLQRMTQDHPRSKLQKWYEENKQQQQLLEEEQFEMDQRKEQYYPHDETNFKSGNHPNSNTNNNKDHHRSLLLLRENRTTTNIKNNSNNNTIVQKQKNNDHNNTKEKDTASSIQNDQQTNRNRKTPLLRSSTNIKKETKTKNNNKKKPVTKNSSKLEEKKDDDRKDQHHGVMASKREKIQEEERTSQTTKSAPFLNPWTFKKNDTNKNTKKKKDENISVATKETTKDSNKKKKNGKPLTKKDKGVVVAKDQAKVKSPSNEEPRQHPYASKLRVIVTGMEHTGTTVLSELIMSAPGLNGPFETGFLLAETPLDFYHTSPFYDWLSRSDIRNAFLELTAPQIADVLNSKTHADMYEYVVHHSKFFVNSPTPTEYYVDKTPLYVYHLREVLERAPSDVKVVVSAKSYEHLKESWTQRHGMTLEEVDNLYELYTHSLLEAQTIFPNRIYVQNYEDLLGKYVKGDNEGANQAGQALFDFLDLEWKDAYLTGKPFKEKGWRNCNLCVLHKT